MRDQYCPNLNCQAFLPFRFASGWGFIDCPGCGIHLMLNDINYPIHWLVVGNRRNPDDLERLEKLFDEYAGFYDSDELFETIKYNWDFLQNYNIDFTTLLGCGGNGCIFPIDDHWVAKFTFDDLEVNAFNYILESDDRLLTRGFVDVASIIELDKHEKLDQAYLIIREYVEPVTTVLDHTQISVLDEAIYYLAHGEIRETLKQWMKRINATDLVNSLTQLREQKIEIGDIKMSNLGVTNDNRVVIFDAQL